LLFIKNAFSSVEDDLASKAMIKYLSWVKYWYGTFYSEDCFNKLQGNTVRIAINQSSNLESNKIFKCVDKRNEITEQKTFVGYITNANFIFQGYWLDNKPIAEISMGSDLNCNNIDDLEPIITDLLKDSKTNFIDVELKSVEQLQIPTIEENIKANSVLDAVIRSMKSFIHYYYFEPTPYGEPQRKFTNVLLNKIKNSNQILLGRFSNDDPFLLVYYEGDDKIYALSFPSIEMLNDNNICMQVYLAHPYWGEISKDERDAMNKHVVDRIKKESIKLDLK
jgi:hypothetical protein